MASQALKPANQSHHTSKQSEVQKSSSYIQITKKLKASGEINLEASGRTGRRKQVVYKKPKLSQVTELSNEGNEDKSNSDPELSGEDQIEIVEGDKKDAFEDF